MRKIKLYIAMSLNGKIAKVDGSVTWLETLPNPDKTDYGYADFYESIDTTIQGFSTYKQVLDWGIDFPYSNKKNYVITRKQNLKHTTFVEFITENHTDFIRQLKNEKGADIWLIGGGQINTLLLNSALIDEIQVFVMPIILSEGIEIFEFLPKEILLKLVETKNFASGAVLLKYEL
jgi:dihydrofolate reductase